MNNDNDPRGWDAATRAKVADALRRGDYTISPMGRQGPQRPPQALHWHSLGQPQPTSLRAALEARSAADAEALRERFVSMDYRRAEERVLAVMAEEGGTITGRMWSTLGACPWDNWKPGRDIA